MLEGRSGGFDCSLAKQSNSSPTPRLTARYGGGGGTFGAVGSSKFHEDHVLIYPNFPLVLSFGICECYAKANIPPFSYDKITKVTQCLCRNLTKGDPVLGKKGHIHDLLLEINLPYRRPARNWIIILTASNFLFNFSGIAFTTKQ